MNRNKIELNFVPPSVTRVEEHDLVRKVERAYRVCYKSENKMSEDSKDLVRRLSRHHHVKRHTSPLEHSCISIRADNTKALQYFFTTEYKAPFIEVMDDRIIGNFRAFHDLFVRNTNETDNPDIWRIHATSTLTNVVLYSLGKALHDKFPEVFPVIEPLTTELLAEDEEKPLTRGLLQKLSNLSISEYKDYYSFMIVTSRDILQELARHRALSPSVESTRYCNYGNKGYTFVIPKPYEWAEQFSWSEQDIATITYRTLQDSLKTIPRKDGTGAEYVAISPMGMIQDYENNMLELFLSNCYTCAARYDKALQLGARPQEARMLMPGGLKTELMMSGYRSYWVNHFLPLRDDKDAHPMMQYIAHEISKLIL